MSDFYRLIFEQLTFVQSAPSRSLFVCFLVVVVLMLAAALIVLHYQFAISPAAEKAPTDSNSPDTLPATPPTDDGASSGEASLPVADESPALAGPGAVLSHLSELCQEFTVTANDVRSYTGKREAQIQEWQRLCTDILRRMLPILDNVTPYLDDEHEQMADFAKVVHGRFLTELTTVGVRVIAPQPGDLFDAGLHLLHPETSGFPPYQVKILVAPGYLFRSRVNGTNEVVLRAAEVIAETIPVAAPEIVEAPGGDDEVPAVNVDAVPAVIHEETGNNSEKAPSLGEALAVDDEEFVSRPPDDDVGSVSSDAVRESAPEAIREVPGDDVEVFTFWSDAEEARTVWVVDESGDILQRNGEHDGD